MDLLASRIRSGGTFGALLALTIGAGSLQATNLLTATSPVALTCNTATGPGTAATIVVKPVTALTGSATIVVTFTAPGGGLLVTAPTTTTLSTGNQAAGLSYSVKVAAGCVGASTGATTITFLAGGVSDATVTANDTVTATTSALVASGISLTCALNSGTYTPGPAQTVSVTSAATGGTPFTVDTGSNAAPAWLTLSSTTGGTATSTPVTFTVVATSGCGSFLANTTHTATLHLDNSPAPDKLVTVSLQILPPSPLTLTPSSPSLTYVKGSGTAGYADVAVASSPSGLFFSVNTATLPIWLTVNTTTGTAPMSVRFSSTSICDTLAPGTYTATVYLKVSGYTDTPITISLLINNHAPTLSVSGGTTQNISWTIGTSTPTPVITLVSSDSPIAYTATSGGTLAPIIPASQQTGLAYSFGTELGVTFNPITFASASPGSVLTGTVTITWGSPVSTTVVTFNLTVVSQGSTLSALSPASLPTAPAGSTFQVILTGTGFVTSTDPTQKTKVGIVVGGTILTDTNFAVSVINPSNISLTITVPTVADTNLPFAVSGTGGTVVIGVCNPGGGSCTIPTGQASLIIGAGPIIQSITSSSSFTEVAPGTAPTTAAYDMLSIFGAGFCSASGTGCSSTQILYGSPDTLTQRYPTSLTPDSGSTPRNLSVTFYVHGSGGASLGSAPLLFATNSQINLLVPSAVAAHIGSGTVDLAVRFATGTPATTETAASSVAIAALNIAASNPGIFTENFDGQGPAAVLNAVTYAPILQSSPAGMRSTASDSDIVSIYVTGLGVPNSTAADTSGGGSTAPTDCISPANYEAALQNATGVSPALSNIDGAIIQASLLDPSRLPPCMATTGGSGTIPSVTIGGVAVTTVGYAGFVDSAVAGLYQVNVTLPGTVGSFTSPSGATITNITAPVQLPVVVTARGVASQPGVTLWVAPRLMVAAPTALSGTVGVVWASSGNGVVASEGTGTYLYSLSSGLLPAGLTLNSDGTITGTPAANTGGSYIVTVTATDSAPVPVTGSVTFTVTVAADLFMTITGTAPFSPGAEGSAYPGITTVTATGGKIAYTYAIGSVTGVGSPTDITLDTVAGTVGVASTAVTGTYHVTITATDSTTGTPLTGSISFDIIIS